MGVEVLRANAAEEPASMVVDLQEPEQRIAVITMHDRVHKNAFSPQLVAGVQLAFETVAHTADRYGAVVLTGYGNYFSSGGTKDGLLAIQAGEQKFTDINLYQLALDCPVPVVAAMQGHAIGGGLAFGLFADFAVLSRESVYTANFMKYGFTPGMGATCILPHRLGSVLGAELLSTAATYRGADLAARGVAYPVVPRSEVLPRAMGLAREIADKPQAATRALKAHLSRPLRDALPAVIEQELAMHAVTFSHPDVRSRVDTGYGV